MDRKEIHWLDPEAGGRIEPPQSALQNASV